MRKNEIMGKGTETALQFSEIVEELAIQEYFGPILETTNAPALVPTVTFPPSGRSVGILNRLKEAYRLLYRGRVTIYSWRFRTRPHPELELEEFRSIGVCSVKLDIETKSTPSFDELLSGVSQPLVYRDSSHTSDGTVEVTGHVIEHRLQASNVERRVPPSFDVTFCRSNHPWIDDLMFTPLSISCSLAVTEAVRRLQMRHGISNLMQDEDDDVVGHSKLINGEGE